MRNFGFLSPNKRTEKLAVLRALFALDAMSEADEEEEGSGSDALNHSDDDAEEPTERICPCCEVGKMIVRREVPRPTECSLGFHPRCRAANILCQPYCNRNGPAAGNLPALGKDSQATLRQLRLDFR